MAAHTDNTHVRLTAHVHGHVQGVGFRWWTRSRALELGLSGYAKNLADGRVEVVAEGTREQTERLLALLREERTTTRRPGRVEFVGTQYGEPRGATGFEER
ncbi:acylphosphatase [Corynebacterium sp. p3-SID1056]|uniref:acylphosphatase n=1 Tax=Corynebacterium sp. p3-SID1056 TaxID=2916092 RepID=UPI0021A53548|nr:acylphosphatase [Corynebacterium sp. p3-SID1056]MCT2337863.1 acylphosphatase [Corynebacterium sp. p3-SID1056]